jgi:predicted RNA-binding Zn-ribbon protein involved in translation (DUF1610 family)
MINEISQAYAGIKAIKEVFSVVLAAKIDVEAQGKVTDALKQLGDVQDNLFTIREKLSNLQEENIALKQSLSEKKAFDLKLSQYVLEETSGGAIVYQFSGNPLHYACPSCIAAKKEFHILQDMRRMTGIYECPSCKSIFPVKPKEATGGGAIVYTDPGLGYR